MAQHRSGKVNGHHQCVGVTSAQRRSGFAQASTEIDYLSRARALKPLLDPLGADIDQLTQIQTADEAFTLCEELKAMMRRMEKCGKPVVAALNGTALGGGLELALGAHYRVASPGANVALPEVKIGLFPGAGGTQRIIRMMPTPDALQFLLKGDQRIGKLVQQISQRTHPLPAHPIP